jgi:hypothetical protein
MSRRRSDSLMLSLELSRPLPPEFRITYLDDRFTASKTECKEKRIAPRLRQAVSQRIVASFTLKGGEKADEQSCVRYSMLSDRIYITKQDTTIEIRSRLNRRDHFQHNGRKYILHTTPITGRMTILDGDRVVARGKLDLEKASFESFPDELSEIGPELLLGAFLRHQSRLQTGHSTLT